MVAGLVLAGCGALGPTSRPRGVQVVAAENTWGAVATSLAGDRASVTSIIASPAVDPHSYEPEAADARAFAQAQITIVNGLGYDTWASQLLAADTPAGRQTINVATTLGLASGSNPHRWYSPDDVTRIADVVTAALVRADPSNTAYFRAQRSRFTTTELRQYFRLIRRIRSRAAGAPVGASESVFAPLSSALGLDLVTPPRLLRAVSDGSDISSSDMAKAQDQIAHHMIRVWVLNTQNSTPSIQILTNDARAAGIPVVSVTETPNPSTATFGAWQTGQLIALARALSVGSGG